MRVNLLPEHHLKFLSLREGCTGLFESTLVKMPHCWKSHVTAHMYVYEPAYTISVLTLLMPMLTIAGGLNFDLTLHLHLHFIYSKSCFKWPLKIDKTKVLKTNGSLMKVESIAECSLGAFCNTFDLH